MRRMLGRHEGFTLIELMIVILIIAILVAIAVPVFLSARSNAQRRTCQANLRTIDGAINTYIADREDGAYPGAASVQSVFVATYIKKLPTCPASSATNSGNTYTLVGAGGSNPPTVSCPGSVSGHSI